MANQVDGFDVAVAVTPSDSADNYFVAFMVTVAGNVAIVDRRGNTTTIPVLASTVYRIACVKVMATNTTATGIIGLN